MVTDLTDTYRGLVKKKGGGKEDKEHRRRGVNDAFTDEANKILGHIIYVKGFLEANRGRYLKNGVGCMNEVEKDNMDHEMKMIIKQSMKRVGVLEDLERASFKQDKPKRSILFGGGGGGSGGSRTGLYQHRLGICWYLNDLLKDVSGTQAGLQQERLMEQQERSKNAMSGYYNNTSASAIERPLPRSPVMAMNDNEEQGSNNNMMMMSQVQVQELEQENQGLIQEFESTLERAKQAEMSLQEISNLQVQLSAQLSIQDLAIQSLYKDADLVSNNVLNANRQLGSARSRNRFISKFIIYSSTILAILIFIYDMLLG